MNFGRYLVEAPAYSDGATVQGSFVFAPNQPEQIGFSAGHRNRYLVAAPTFLDTVVQVLAQQYLFPVSQPELDGFFAAQRNRWIIDAPKRTEGATVQDWFIYPANQPEPSQIKALLNSLLDTLIQTIGCFDGVTLITVYPAPARTYTVLPEAPDRLPSPASYSF